MGSPDHRALSRPTPYPFSCLPHYEVRVCGRSLVEQHTALSSFRQGSGVDERSNAQEANGKHTGKGKYKSKAKTKVKAKSKGKERPRQRLTELQDEVVDGAMQLRSGQPINASTLRMLDDDVFG
ncbi:hypothetical protein PINS_up005458 [Pythium insidiosum]|nr:hypothetical protein PINS_up005458 [Pythium insidiosum]